ncbi:MAG: DNA-processing protein DprA [Clostridia bacterium]|nr:DNA-processing protein DprA [Clostridia bacterium]
MTNKNKLYWVWLSLLCQSASRRAVNLIRYFEDAKGVFKADESELEKCGIIKKSDALFSEILKHDTDDAESIVSWCNKAGVDIITPDDKNYPSNLYSLRDAPLTLYCVGELPDLDANCSVAVVGSRNMTDYGAVNAFRFGYGLARAGAIVVSGLALGIDSMAMASALAGGGATVGVLGCGIDVVYPKEHEKLFKAVAKSGAVITEYPPGSRPKRNSFPQRNRIISALSQGTLVIEAASDSGSLITARHAVYQGKDLFALPGSVGREMSEGTNFLIKEGAFAVTRPADILERYEYVYPHTLDLSYVRTEFKEIDFERSAERVRLMYGVTTDKERSDVYSKRSAPRSLDEPPVVFIGEDSGRYDNKTFDFDDTYKKPDVLPAKSRADAKKSKPGFADAPSEPKRIDFELLSEKDLKIYNSMIPDTPMIQEELISDDITIADVMASMTMLEVSGAIEAGAGGYFMRTSADDITLPDEEI